MNILLLKDEALLPSALAGITAGDDDGDVVKSITTEVSLLLLCIVFSKNTKLLDMLSQSELTKSITVILDSFLLLFCGSFMREAFPSQCSE
jgi:hypothetical protein